MEKQEVLAGLLQELRRGIIVLCVLGRLDTPKYGYSLVTELDEAGVSVEANTLYPLLRRLEGQGLLQSTWETGGAKPRKYYTTTAMGREVYEALKMQWTTTQHSVSALLEGTEGEGPGDE
ncbi:PadR family transcriptional regulator [Ruminococcaceae bacterium OttesenSCG-928-A11]|nr:PadR family transcriptional regulator [Ruminococcaceae bacterium OttesenSCG-928-A11]